jgi:hypothetical protein
MDHGRVDSVVIECSFVVFTQLLVFGFHSNCLPSGTLPGHTDGLEGIRVAMLGASWTAA